MICYVDGTPAEVGDTVLIDNGERTGRVSVVIDDEALKLEWGVEVAGLMIESDYYGLLFAPTEEIREMECKLISRSASS